MDEVVSIIDVETNKKTQIFQVPTIISLVSYESLSAKVLSRGELIAMQVTLT